MVILFSKYIEHTQIYSFLNIYTEWTHGVYDSTEDLFTILYVFLYLNMIISLAFWVLKYLPFPSSPI